jgi:hypothetical protein
VSLVTRMRRRLRSLVGRSNLDVVIPPEIIDDPFADLIRTTAAKPDVLTVLEIGSSSGAGSTRSLVEGLSRKPGARLYCLELSEPRFKELEERYRSLDWVDCINASSVTTDGFPSEEEVANFVEAHGGSDLYGDPVAEVVRWLRMDKAYLERFAGTPTGIEQAIDRNGGREFDLVLIDGSEFTGYAELDAVYGARYVLLDDTRTFKNHASRRRLLSDPDYRLVAEDLGWRNGYAAFSRVDEVVQ